MKITFIPFMLKENVPRRNQCSLDCGENPDTWWLRQELLVALKASMTNKFEHFRGNATK